ncbi:MAG: anaerobic sulfatase maturase [Candidatus Hydrogenedentes bacterium]|nr:anaerobic sulfatase maturase [Candidatus Hydrogenedentota bacterium]
MKDYYPFHIMAKPVGPTCNLRCEYCFYLEKYKMFPSIKVMQEQVLKKFIQEYISVNPSEEIVFGWQGGEPTIAGTSFFKKAVEYQELFSLGKKIINTFQTNGVNLNEEWIDFLTTYNFLVGISIDGPKSIHDNFRKDKENKGSFEKVLSAIKIMREKGTEFNTLTCVHKKNWMKGREIYNFLKSVGSRFMQFIPIVERYTHNRKDGLFLGTPCDEAYVTEWSITPEQWGQFLVSVFDEWVKMDVGKIFVQIFDMVLTGWVGLEPPLCVMSKECGRALIIEADGSIYSCDHYVYPEFYLGNILEKPLSEIVYCDFQKEFGKSKSFLPKECLECKYLHVCNGGCPKHRFLEAKCRDSNSSCKRNYLCEGYYMFFDHISPYMDTMAELVKKNLPPAFVMDIFSKERVHSESREINPNTDCPCGSGKKYKKCCGKFS